MIEQNSQEGVRFFQFESLNRLGVVSHGCFSRLGGVSLPPYATLNSSYRKGDDPLSVDENWERIKRALPVERYLTVRPHHGNTIIQITPADYCNQPEVVFLPIKADGIITNASNLALFFNAADCCVMLCVDPVKHAIGVFHAGWRGSSLRIASLGIAALQKTFGSSPQDIHVGISPYIGPCCYRSSLREQAAFLDPETFGGRHFSSHDGSLWFDVGGVNYDQLVSVGVQPNHIEMGGFCTGHMTNLFFSNYIEERNGNMTGRNPSMIALF